MRGVGKLLCKLSGLIGVEKVRFTQKADTGDIWYPAHNNEFEPNFKVSKGVDERCFLNRGGSDVLFAF